MSATIAPRDVTVTGLTANGRQYDGTTAATVNTGSALVNNVVNGESLGYSGTAGVFSSANAGARSVAATGGALTAGEGTLLGNYNLAGTNAMSATIARRSASVSRAGNRRSNRSQGNRNAPAINASASSQGSTVP